MAFMKNAFIPCLFLMLMIQAIASPEPSEAAPKPLFFGVALDGYPIQTERLRNIREEIGTSPQLVVFFLQWPSPDALAAVPFPRDTLDAIWEAGAIPCLTWEPMYYIQDHEVTVSCQDIFNGVYDPYLVRFAEQAAVWKKPFMIRFAHEMNIARYHWGTDKNGYGRNSPAIYRRMYRYVVRLFQKADADNVVWVFCPNSESVPNASYDPNASWNRIEAYYPGDALVDVLGMDGYNWGTTQTKTKNGWDSHWRTFADTFRPAWETLRRLAPDKPICVFETASVKQGGDKATWIRNACHTALEWNLVGLVWFQANKEYDWRINSGETIWCRDIVNRSTCSPHEWIKGLGHDQETAD